MINTSSTELPTDAPPKLEFSGSVATLTLQRPTVANRLCAEDLAAIIQHVDTINRNAETMVVLVRGLGKHFCSGYDISEVANSSQTRGQSFGEMVDALENCKAVTIAVVHGGVYGGATDMALACDFRMGVAATEMFMPAARLGLHFYGSGLQRYVARLGPDTTRRLFLTAEKLDADAMLKIGYLTHLATDQSALTEDVKRLCQTLLEMAPLALLGMKRAINQISAQGSSLNAQDLAALDASVMRTVHSQDLAEGIRAWAEKRKPIFVGR
jgi:enoyl-CoA hydratase/carnithine racemase